MYSGSARVPIAAVAGKFGVHYTNAYILHTDLVGEEKKEEKGKFFFSHIVTHLLWLPVTCTN